ncbi:hypothetical protein SDC9_132168 [bioreactor metagenome]|uniref:Uncharacterized protein n=1 Tax=bioreactor metagenome TaxID=1076179 RepID=A0A645D762_9ZZZZ
MTTRSLRLSGESQTWSEIPFNIKSEVFGNTVLLDNKQEK